MRTLLFFIVLTPDMPRNDRPALIVPESPCGNLSIIMHCGQAQVLRDPA
jgi:hypothetical protein